MGERDAIKAREAMQLAIFTRTETWARGFRSRTFAHCPAPRISAAWVTDGVPSVDVDARDLTAADLRALADALEPPKPLTAAEVTEPGWYWWRGDSAAPWGVLEVHGVVESTGVWLSDVSAPALIPFRDLTGTFIGPLRAPEGV